MKNEAVLNPNEADAGHLAKLLERSDRLLIKKLSRNDRDWARFTNKHQAGVYIPYEQRDGGFFNPLHSKAREHRDEDEIHEAFFKTIWPQFENAEKQTRLVHYTSKGQETHMTRLLKEAFTDLLPASYLVMGRFGSKDAYFYECLTIDSDSDEAAFLTDFFGLGPNFLIDEFAPAKLREEQRDQILDFADQVIFAWLKGQIAHFAIENAAIPPTAVLARKALRIYLEQNGLEKIDPFIVDAPGDALREISRNIEWNLFREYQKRERSVEVIRALLGDSPWTIQATDIIRRLIDRLPEIDAIMLSASQQRKSRAGYSYEHHIEALLLGGGIPYEKQVIIESRKRPDFILPSLRFIEGPRIEAKSGLILSAKTTLRERWKQVEREKKDRRLFLTTVDENIAENAIEDMASIGIYLVIPESLIKSKETEYANHENVISFKTFCEQHVKPNLEKWKQATVKA
jgi:hypothetical protein